MKRTFSLRIKFFLISVGLLFFGLIFFTLLILPYISEQLQKTELDEIRINNNNVANNIHNEIQDLESSVYIVAYGPTMEDYVTADTGESGEKLRKMMFSVMEGNKFITSLKYLSASGDEIIGLNRTKNGSLISESRANRENRVGRQYFQEAMVKPTRMACVSQIEPASSADRNPIMRISYSVADRTGKKMGVVTAIVDIGSVFNKFNTHTYGEFMVTDSKGYYINHPDPEKQFGSPAHLNTGFNIRNDYPVDAGTILLGEKGFLEKDNRTLWLRRIRPDLSDKSKDIILINSISDITLLKPINNILQSIMLIYTIILGSMIAALYLLVNRLMRPILSLTEAIKPIASGDFSRRIVVESTDELGVLSHAIDSMRLKLAQLYKDMDERVRDKTSELQAKITELQWRSRETEGIKNAMLNIAEDLENEKNITLDEKRKAELLAKDLEKFKLATESASDHITISDTDGIILYANKAVTTITGFGHDEIIGQKVGSKDNWGGLMDEEFYKRLWSAAKAERRSFVGEFINKRKNGEKYIGLVTVTPILDYSGKVLFFVENQRDITDLKEKEKEKAKDEAILDNLGECLVVTDVDGKIALVNRAFEKKTGWSKNEAVGQDLIKFLPLVDQRNLPVKTEERALYKVLNKITHEAYMSTSSQTNYYITKDKRSIPVYGVVTPIMFAGKIIGAVQIFRDITKEKEIDKLKDDFISVASHELRTPLTAIDGIVSMILDGEYGQVNSNLRQPLSDVSYSSQRLIHLVNDLLNMSRIQAGRLKYRISNYKCKESIDVVVKMLASIAESRGIKLSSDNFGDETVQADRDKIEQILNNLIGNSLKFTDKGSVKIGAVTDGQLLKIKITDTGIGISESDRAKLFGKFQQLDSGVNRPQGTGLGLHISRQMARTMGGDVYLESSVIGVGSVFVLSIPMSGTELAAKIINTIEEEALFHKDQK